MWIVAGAVAWTVWIVASLMLRIVVVHQRGMALLSTCAVMV